MHSEATLPPGLRSGLKEHQLYGLRWLQGAWQQGMPGVLLADDMGLGKTLQALAFLAWLKESAPADPAPNAGGVLIVAPTSLLHNWKAEHDKHLEQPGLGNVLQVHGSHLKHVRRSAGSGLNVETLRHADWVLTTYETLKGYQTDFASVRFRCLVLDEAQKVKSPDTQVTSATKALNAEFKIAMTGTPVENRRADIWCVSDTVYPGLLGSLKDFSADYERDESREAAARPVRHKRTTCPSLWPNRMPKRRRSDPQKTRTRELLEIRHIWKPAFLFCTLGVTLNNQVRLRI